MSSKLTTVAGVPRCRDRDHEEGAGQEDQGVQDPEEGRQQGRPRQRGGSQGVQ